jgi:carnitine O-acetyltransferase
LSLNPFFILSQSPTPTPPPPPPSSSTTGPSTATLVPPNHVQLTRASSLILSSLSFIHDLRTGQLAPDVLRGGKPLDMSQYERLFGTARVPRGKGGCEMKTDSTSRHVVVIRRGQICASRWLVPVWRSARLTLSPRSLDYMTLLDAENRPLVTEREIQRHLRAIVDDADKTAANEAARGAVGVLSE